MYRVTGFSPSVLSQQDLRFEDLSSMLGVPNWEELLEVYANHYSLVLWHGDEFVGCGGVTVLWPGVGEAWVIAAPDIEKHGYQVYRTCKKGIDAAEKNLRLRRIQATVLAEKWTWRRFAQRMGFGTEGHLLSYGPDGKDYVMMARLKEWDQQ